MKPFRNRGWKWLRIMEKITPVAGATGSHSYAATEANPPSLACDPDEDIDYVSPQPLSGNNSMDIDSTGQPTASTSTPTSATSTNILPQPSATGKRPRLDSDSISALPFESGSANAAPSLSVSSDRTKKSQKISEKGKGKARTGSDCSSSSLIQPTTSQRVEKVTPGVAIVELHGSIKEMTQAILVASKPPESLASSRCQEAVRLVQERNDGLSVMEQATLIVFFGSHEKEADMYIALEEDELRRAVVRQWLGNV